MIHAGDCLAVMATMDAGSVDAIVTDPPYGLGFMGKRWDSLPPGREWGEACLRVLKPGGHLLAFGGTRTSHRLACAIEDAGFEIRDTIAWLYGSGFPKGKGCLKPAYEPIVMARTPGAKGVVLNVDECRISHNDDLSRYDRSATSAMGYHGVDRPTLTPSSPLGRWPANVVLDPEAAAMLDEQGGASRFFYVAKASSAERNAGLDAHNVHPTVKPIALMRWLCRLVTRPGGLILDPFAGSGTTGCAAALEGFQFVGIEREPDYVDIARARIAHWASQPSQLSLAA